LKTEESNELPPYVTQLVMPRSTSISVLEPIRYFIYSEGCSRNLFSFN